MKVQILVDNIHSWVMPYAKALVEDIKALGINTSLVHRHEDIVDGDVLVLLSCEGLLKKMDLNKHNLVVHASKLPEGRGWSPLTWQILEGRNEIFLTLFEAAEKVDSGVVYSQERICFEGHELIDEMRQVIGEKSNEMVLDFIKKYPDNLGTDQQGEPTFYPRRKPEDAELDIHKSLDSQFNLLRISDNDKYPAFFYRGGHKYILKIYKAD